MLAFSMPRLPSSILDRNRFKRQADRCHSLSTSHKPVLSPLCFHGLTNCFSRKPFAFINICVAPRVSPPTVHSMSSRKKPSALESATSTLFHKAQLDLDFALGQQAHQFKQFLGGYRTSAFWGGQGLWLVSSKSASSQRDRQAHTEYVDNDAYHHHLQRERKPCGC